MTQEPKTTPTIVEQAVAAVRRECGQRPQVALMLAEQLTRAAGGHAASWRAMGLAYTASGRAADAVQALEKAAELEPGHPDGLNNLALSYAACGRTEDALRTMERALAARPDDVRFLNNLALQYRRAEKFEAAEVTLRWAAGIEETAPILTNLAGILAEGRRPGEAETALRRAIALSPEYAAAHVDLAFLLMQDGRFEEGYAEYEWRDRYFPQMAFYRRLFDPAKTWDGGPPSDGGRLLVHGEQGVGDVIQFSRMLTDVAALGWEVILHAPTGTSRLLSHVAGVSDCFEMPIHVAKPEDVPEHDAHCKIMSLPRLLGKYEWGGAPYLKVQRDGRLAVPSVRRNVRVGVAWAGNPHHPEDARRSVSAEALVQAASVPGVDVYSLQKGAAAKDLPEGVYQDMGASFGDWHDTAAALRFLDLVVCVDTGLAHLCGATGTDCLTLIPAPCDWRWGLESERCGWYDSLTLLRQPSRGDWDSVMQRLSDKVSERVADFHTT